MPLDREKIRQAGFDRLKVAGFTATKEKELPSVESAPTSSTRSVPGTPGSSKRPGMPGQPPEAKPAAPPSPEPVPGRSPEAGKDAAAQAKANIDSVLETCKQDAEIAKKRLKENSPLSFDFYFQKIKSGWQRERNEIEKLSGPVRDEAVKHYREKDAEILLLIEDLQTERDKAKAEAAAALPGPEPAKSVDKNLAEKMSQAQEAYAKAKAERDRYLNVKNFTTLSTSREIVDKALKDAELEYEKAKAEYIAAGKFDQDFLKKREQKVQEKLDKRFESKNLFGKLWKNVEKPFVRIYDFYKSLDKYYVNLPRANSEKWHGRAINKVLPQRLSLRSGISLGLLGAGMATGAIIGPGITVGGIALTRKVFGGGGAAVGSYDLGNKIYQNWDRKSTEKEISNHISGKKKLNIGELQNLLADITGEAYLNGREYTSLQEDQLFNKIQSEYLLAVERELQKLEGMGWNEEQISAYMAKNHVDSLNGQWNKEIWKRRMVRSGIKAGAIGIGVFVGSGELAKLVRKIPGIKKGVESLARFFGVDDLHNTTAEHVAGPSAEQVNQPSGAGLTETPSIDSHGHPRFPAPMRPLSRAVPLKPNLDFLNHHSGHNIAGNVPPGGKLAEAATGGAAAEHVAGAADTITPFDQPIGTRGIEGTIQDLYKHNPAIQVWLDKQYPGNSNLGNKAHRFVLDWMALHKDGHYNFDSSTDHDLNRILRDSSLHVNADGSMDLQPDKITFMHPLEHAANATPAEHANHASVDHTHAAETTGSPPQEMPQPAGTTFHPGVPDEVGSPAGRYATGSQPYHPEPAASLNNLHEHAASTLDTDQVDVSSTPAAQPHAAPVPRFEFPDNSGGGHAGVETAPQTNYTDAVHHNASETQAVHSDQTVAAEQDLHYQQVLEQARGKNLAEGLKLILTGHTEPFFDTFLKGITPDALDKIQYWKLSEVIVDANRDEAFAKIYGPLARIINFVTKDFTNDQLNTMDVKTFMLEHLGKILEYKPQ